MREIDLSNAKFSFEIAFYRFYIWEVIKWGAFLCNKEISQFSLFNGFDNIIICVFGRIIAYK